MRRLRRIYRDLTNTEKALLLTIGVFIAVIVVGNIFIL